MLIVKESKHNYVSSNLFFTLTYYKCYLAIKIKLYTKIISEYKSSYILIELKN